MSLKLPLPQLRDIAIEAAREAGQFVQSVAAGNIKRKFKNTGSSKASQIVTEVDLHSEAIIRERLQPVSKQWSIAFVGEESSPGSPGTIPERLIKPYFWCVDPLDGTLPFVEAKPGYAVSIALVEQSGSPLIGVIYDPVDSTLMHAIKGQGAYSERTPFRENSQKPTTLTVFADASLPMHNRFESVSSALNQCAKNLGLDGVTMVYGSGAVKNACQVLESAAACYVKLPKAEEGGGSIWDFAATACIVNEAGAWVSNTHGDPLELNRSDSTFMNHQGVIYASTEQIARNLIDTF